MKPRTWVAVTLGFIAVGTVLQLGGVVAPMWIFLEPDHGNYTIGVGLYYRVGCERSSGNICPDVTEDLSFGYTDDDTYDKDFWTHLTWLETLGGVMALLLTIMAVVYLVGFGTWRWLSWLNNAMVLIAIITWVPIVAGLILFAIEKGEVITKSPDVSSVSFPWSALMCFIAAFIFIVVTFLIRTKCRMRRYMRNAIPPSADTKMILNPSTQSQLINRFFTPSPYREDRRQALQSSAYHGDQSALLGNGTTPKAISNGYTNQALEYTADDTRVINGGTRVETRTVENNVGNSQRLVGEDVGRRNRDVVETKKISVIEDVPYNYSRVISTAEVPPSLGISTRLEQQDFQDYSLQRQQQQHQLLQQQRMLQLQQQEQMLQLQQQQQQQREQQQRQNVITRTVTTTNNYRTGLEGNDQNTVAQRFANTQPDFRLQADDQVIERRQDDRTYGNTYAFNRQGEINTYGGNDTNDGNRNTVFYTGRYLEQSRPAPLLIETDQYALDGYRNEGNRNDVTRVVQRNIVQTQAEPAERDFYGNEPSRAESRRFFRVGAGTGVREDVGLKTQYTSHIKTADVDERADRVVLAPGNLLTDGGNLYNNTNIYRPFSGQKY